MSFEAPPGEVDTRPVLDMSQLSPADNPAELLFSTFLGGSGDDRHRHGTGQPGRTTLAGWTNSNNFPTTPGTFDASFNGSTDAFVVRFNADGSALVTPPSWAATARFRQ